MSSTSMKKASSLVVVFLIVLGISTPWLWTYNNILTSSSEEIETELRLAETIDNDNSSSNTTADDQNNKQERQQPPPEISNGEIRAAVLAVVTPPTVAPVLATTPANIESEALVPPIGANAEDLATCTLSDLQAVQLDENNCWSLSSNVEWQNVHQMSLNLDQNPCFFSADYSKGGCNLHVSVRNMLEIFTAKQHSYHVDPSLCDTSTGPMQQRMAFINITGNVAVQSIGNGVVFGGKFLFKETLDQYAYQNWERSALSIPQGGTLTPASLPAGTEKLILALNKWGYTWQHLAQDQLDNIGFFWDELEKDPSLKILLDEGEAPARNRAELLTLLGLNDRIVTPNGRYDTFYPAKALYYLDKDPRLPGTKPYGLQRIRGVVSKAIHCDPSAPRDLFVMYTRPSSGTRYVGNQVETEDALKEWVKSLFGDKVQVMVYNPGSMSLEESLKLSCRAIGALHPHGGCLYHTLTMPSRSVVIELIPKTGMCTTGTLYNRALGHEFFQVSVDGDREYGPLHTNMDFLKAAFTDVEKYLKENGLA